MKLTTFIKEKFTLPRALGVTEKAEDARNKMVLRASRIAPVVDAPTQNTAAVVARDIHTHVQAVRAAGLALRRPLQKALKMIKAVEDDHVQPLLEHQGRIEAEISQFQTEEMRRVAEEERAQREQLRAKLNAQAQAEASGNGEAQAALAVREVLALPLPEPVKAAGVATKRVVKWIVTDKAALFKARPELFNVEVRPSAINATCFPQEKATVDQPDGKIPGLLIWWELETNVRKW